MTMAMDSVTPSSHPFKTMIATTLQITLATQMIASTEIIIFPVDTSKMTNEKPTAAAMPEVADDKNALSDSNHAHVKPAVCTPD